MITGHRSGRKTRHLSGLLITLLFSSLFVTGFTATAHADAYRFWGFWQFQEGAWAFASKGPTQTTPKDGEIEGWRYAISGDSTGQRVPRATVTFDDLCAGTPAAAGKKRVGVVIDFGTANEAPNGVTPPPARGDCAQVDAKATSAQALAQVATVREQKGLFCAVDSFPAAGCGDPVADKDVPKVPEPEPTVQLQLAQPAPADTTPAESDSTATATPGQDGTAEAESEPAGNSFPIWAIVALVIVLLAAGAFWQVRRRKAAASGSSGSGSGSGDSSTD